MGRAGLMGNCESTLEHGTWQNSHILNLGVREFKAVTGCNHLESQHREKD